MSSNFTIIALLALCSTTVAAPLPEGAVEVPLDMTKAVTRVVVEPAHASPNSVLVDVGFNSALNKRLPQAPADPQPGSVVVRAGAKELEEAWAAEPEENYTLVATALAVGDEFHGVFEANIPDTVVGVFVKSTKRREQVVVDIKPMYVTPSGAKMLFNRKAGLQHLKKLYRVLGDAQEFSVALPDMRRALETAERQHRDLLELAARRSRASTLQEFAAGPINPQVISGSANNIRRRKVLIQRAEFLVSKIPMLEKDLKAVEAVGLYGSAISTTAKVYVRVYAGSTVFKPVVQ